MSGHLRTLIALVCCVGTPARTQERAGWFPFALPWDDDSATVTSEAALFPPDGFGPSAPRDSSGQFALDYTVPTSTAPGTYLVGLRCGGGNVGVAASLTVAPSGGPATGAGGTAASSSSPWTAVGGAFLLLAGLGMGLRGRVARRRA